MELRQYQHDALNALRAEFGPGHKLRVILYSPTGSGKTEMGIEMIRSAVAKNRKVGFICNRVELVNQASRRFHASGLDHGVIQGNNTWGTYKPVLVCSIQTLASRGYPEGLDLLVIDEAHAVAGSAEYRKLIAACNCPVIGLSATPMSKGLGKRYDDIGGELFEAIAKSVTIRDLIELGYLVDVDIYAPGEPDLTGVKIVAGDYHEKQLGEAVDKPVLIGDIVTHWRKLSGHKRTVCFATNIAHSKHICEQFQTAGIHAEHIDCYTEEDERKKILKRLENGETTIVSNVSVLAEGWDMPSVEVMILARPTRSLIRYIQMAGRVLRPAPGKERAIILDHSGSCKKLGFPTDDLPLVLDDGKPRKVNSTSSDKDEPLPMACQSCHYMKPAKVHECPKCGFAAEKRSDVTTQDGELVKLKKGKSKLDKFDKAALYGELKSIASERGWSKGRLANVFRDITGVWPNHYQDEPAREPTHDTISAVKYLNIRYAKSKARREVANV